MDRVRNMTVGRTLFGSMVLAALAFGAREATATPAAAGGAAKVCSATRCNSLCIKAGFDGGYCYGGYDCVCY